MDLRVQWGLEVVQDHPSSPSHPSIWPGFEAAEAPRPCHWPCTAERASRALWRSAGGQGVGGGRLWWTPYNKDLDFWFFV